MESNIPGAAHPCQYLDPASALTLFPQVTRIVPVGPWGSPVLPRNVVGNTSTHQLGCCFSREFLRSISFLQNLSGSACSAATAVPLIRPHLLFLNGQGKAPVLLLDPPTLTAQPFPAHSISSPPAASLPALMQITGQAVARKCCSFFPPTRKLLERFLRERERSLREHHTGQELIFL